MSKSAKADIALAALMRAAQSGDRRAYVELLHRSEPIVRRVATRVGVRGEAVEDVIQETLLTLHNARHTYDPNRSFTAWLTVIAQRRRIDALRRAGRTARRKVHAPAAYESCADADADPARSSFEASRCRREPGGLASPIERP